MSDLLLPTGHLDGILRDFFGASIQSLIPAGSLAFQSPELGDSETQEPWIWAAMDLGALVVTMTEDRYWLGEPGQPGVREAPRTEMQAVLERPNPLADSAWLIQCDWLNLIRSGESFWFLQGPDGKPVKAVGEGVRARIETPAAIWPVDGSLVSEIRNENTGIVTGWRAPSARGGQEVYPAHSVILHMHRPRRDTPWRGIGPIGAAFGLAAQNYVARRFTDRLLRNDGRVAGVLILDGTPKDSELNRIRADMEANWNNPSNAGKWRLATGAAKVHSEPTTPRDMEFAALLKENKENLAAVLQTPGALLGLDTTNYATFAGHFKRYLQLRIVPWLMARARTLNERLFPSLRDARLSTLRVSFDVDRLSRITADPREQSESARGLIDAGVPITSALRHVGVQVDEFPGGDVPMVAPGRVSLLDAQTASRANAILAQAAAAQALVSLGVDADEALTFVGLPLTVTVEPEDEQDPNATDSSDNADSTSQDNSGKSVIPTTRGAIGNQTLVASQVGSPQPAPRVTRYVQTVGDRASSHRERDARRPLINQTNRKVRGVWWRMRLEQVRVLERFAATGERPELKSRPARWIFLPRVAAVSLIEAVRKESVQGWRQTWTRFASHPLDRLLLRALSITRGWTEGEIEALVVAGAVKWRDQLAEALGPGITSAYVESAKRTRLGLGFPGSAVPAEILTTFADKAVLVAEGSTSAAAQAIRTAILRVLAKEGNNLGSLQEAIKAALEDVKAGTTRAFATLNARALAIARTEVNASAAAANYQELLEAYRQGHIRAVRWLTSGRGPEPGGTVRDSHWDMEGQEVVPGTRFVSGAGHRALHPYGFGIASEDIQCECRLQGVLADGQADNSVTTGTDETPDLSARDLDAVIRSHEDEIVRSATAEKGIAVDLKGRTVVAKTGQARFIRWRQPEAERLRGTVFTHNHPTGHSFPVGDPRRAGNSLSLDDVLFGAKWSVAEMRAVSPGWRHSLTPGAGGWPAEQELRDAFALAEAEVGGNFWRLIHAAEARPERERAIRFAEANHFHEVWIRVAKRLGLTYTREALNA